jgi:hypothetical protein
MKRFLILWLAAALTACAPKGPQLPAAKLDQAIASSIGDPTTCVLIVERATGHTVYSYNAGFDCTRGLPACDRPGVMSAKQAMPLALTPGGRKASCPSNADGSRTVGWAEGKVISRHYDLVYSAVMEGDRALPGEEIASRLDNVFVDSGI